MKTGRVDLTKLLGFLAAAFILLPLVFCSTNVEDAILGKWSEIGGTEKMEFFEDGTITVADGRMYMGGHYTLVDQDRIRVDFDGLGELVGPLVVRVSISGDELTWIMPDGEVSRYKKAK